MKKLVIFTMLVSFALLSLAPSGVLMQQVFAQNGILGDPEEIGLPRIKPESLITDVVLPLAYTLIGVVSVIVILVGALRFTLARGDPGSIKSARDTILYGLIGLAIAILAFTIVSLVGSVTESAV